MTQPRTVMELQPLTSQLSPDKLVVGPTNARDGSLDLLWTDDCRGASKSACAGLTNQLVSCWGDPRMLG